MSAITSILLAAVAAAEADPDECTCVHEALYRADEHSPSLGHVHRSTNARWEDAALATTGLPLIYGTDCCYHDEPDNQHLIADLRDAAQVEALVSGACQ